MSKKTYTGLNSSKSINIVWKGCPNNSYFTIRNHSFDDTIKVKQVISVIHTETNIEEVKEIITPLKKGEQQSFLVEQAAKGLEIQSGLDYTAGTATIPKYTRGATVIVDELPNQGGRAVFDVAIISSRDYMVDVSNTDKSEIFFSGKTDRSIETTAIKNTKYPTALSDKKNVLLAPSVYQTHTGAGRGYLIRSLEGMGVHKTADILKQVEEVETQIGNTETNKKDTNLNLKTAEVPYLKSFSKEYIRTYNDSKDNAKEVGNFTDENVMADLMFLIEPSQSDDNNLRYVNIQNNSGITKLGTLKTPEDSSPISYTPSGWVGDETSLIDSKMYKVDQNSKAQWYQHLFNVEKIKGFAVTVKTVSRKYPYTLVFAGPLLTGITFNSASQIKVNMRDREAIFNNVEHEGKVLRICAVYGVTFIELYVNGKRIEHETQSNNNIAGKEINTIGLDCREFYQTAPEAVNIASKVLGSNKATSLKVSEQTVNPDNDRVEPNLKTVSYQPVKATDNRPVLLPKGESNKIIPFGSRFPERTGWVISIFMSMDLTGLTPPSNPESDPAYTKTVTMNKSDTHKISCYGSDPNLLPLIKKSTTNDTITNLDVIKVAKGRASQIDLYKSHDNIVGTKGAQTEYNITIDQDLFVGLPATNRVVNVEFINPVTAKVQVRLSITIN